MTATNVFKFRWFQVSSPLGQTKVQQLQRRFFINFMSEKLCSADAVEMGIRKHMVASLCRLRNNAISMSLVSNSFSCMYISSFVCLELTIHFPLCAEVRRDNGCLLNSVPSNNLAGKSLQNCPMRV